jgi:glucose-1-phosphate thymidylyltransferase
MKALVLAAGYATRLYPLTKDYPKPLLKLGSKPIIDYIIEKLDLLDEIDEIIVITNSRFFSHFSKWSKSVRVNKKISLIDDLTKSLSDKLGAIGDMDFAIQNKSIKDDLMVIGGDNLFDDSLKGFLSFAKSKTKSPVLGAYNIGNKTDAKKYGVLKLNKENKVINFQEKPSAPKSTLVAMCLYYFPKSKLALIKEYLGKKNKQKDATGLYIDWLRRRVAVYGFVFGGRWYDIGDHKFYNEAKKKFING